MNAKKYLPIALFIGLQAFALQALNQAICANIPPLAAGGGWISFQAWAMYFLGGCTPKGGARALIGYGIGMAASIAIMVGGGALGALGFWAMPVILLILVPIILEAVPIDPSTHPCGPNCRQAALKNLEIHKVFLRFFALPAAIFPRKPAYFGYWYSFYIWISRLRWSILFPPCLWGRACTSA